MKKNAKLHRVESECLHKPDMISEFCKHCHEIIDGKESVRYNNHSYHSSCMKCFVCNEVDLRGAETFQGAIFCASCSRRIFLSCAGARKSRYDQHDRHSIPSPRSSSRRRRSRRRPVGRPEGIIELARMAASSYSDTPSDTPKSNDSRLTGGKRLNNNIVMTAQTAPREVFAKQASYELKKCSIDQEISTEVTQELLQQVEYANSNSNLVLQKAHTKSRPITTVKEKEESREQKMQNSNWSDLRIAELGASTEIDSMGLRKKSERQPPKKLRRHCTSDDTLISRIASSGRFSKEPPSVKMKTTASASEHGQYPHRRVVGRRRLRRATSPVRPAMKLSDSGADNVEESENLHEKRNWLDKPILSLMVFPFKLFKKRIIDRSSYISLVSKQYAFNNSVKKTLQQLFCDNVIEHQHRGIKRLFPTINKRQSPLRLGLSIENIDKRNKNEKSFPEKRCKHFDRSHSYRCMRNLVMTRAGPTCSELAVIRKKLRKIVIPRFIRKYFSLSEKHVKHLPSNLLVVNKSSSLNQIPVKRITPGIKKSQSFNDPHDPKKIFQELTSATYIDTSRLPRIQQYKKRSKLALDRERQRLPKLNRFYDLTQETRDKLKITQPVALKKSSYNPDVKPWPRSRQISSSSPVTIYSHRKHDMDRLVPRKYRGLQ